MTGLRKTFLPRILLGMILGFFPSWSWSQIAAEGYVVSDPTGEHFRTIQGQADLILDHRTLDRFEVWGPEGLGLWLAKNQIPHSSADVRSKSGLRSLNYPTPEAIEKKLKTLAEKHKDTARLFSIGKSVEGRDLWVMKVSRNVSVDDSRPEFKFIANMHGDEIVGRELMVKLLEKLLTQDGKNSRVTALLNEIQIYIMPSMNPDGALAQRRGNAKFVDLNRNFPEYVYGDENSPLGRAPETQAVMNWQAQRKFQLSANFHGGAEVVNYPWDALDEAHPMEAWIKNLSIKYAADTVYMAQSEEFAQGVTRGFTWYPVYGGMQDWSDRFYRDLQVTIELSEDKWPDYEKVETYWKSNEEALLGYIEAVQQVPPRSIQRRL